MTAVVVLQLAAAPQGVPLATLAGAGQVFCVPLQTAACLQVPGLAGKHCSAMVLAG